MEGERPVVELRIVRGASGRLVPHRARSWKVPDCAAAPGSCCQHWLLTTDLGSPGSQVAELGAGLNHSHVVQQEQHAPVLASKKKRLQVAWQCEWSFLAVQNMIEMQSMLCIRATRATH